MSRQKRNERAIAMVLAKESGVMSIFGSLRATSLVWAETEAPSAWNRSGKKPLYMLCDW